MSCVAAYSVGSAPMSPLCANTRLPIAISAFSIALPEWLCRFVAAQPGWAATRPHGRAGRLEAALQLGHEQQVGELGLPVGAVALVAALPIEVVEPDPADAVRAGRDDDDAVGMRGSSRLVSAKWPRWLVPICISNPSAVRCSGTFITPALLISTSTSPVQSVGEGADAGQVGEVEPADLGVAVDRRGGLLALRGVAHGQHDVRAGARQRRVRRTSRSRCWRR